MGRENEVSSGVFLVSAAVLDATVCYMWQVVVEDLETHQLYEFPCQRWLAKDEDDGRISRDLIVGVGADDAHGGKHWEIVKLIRCFMLL